MKKYKVISDFWCITKLNNKINLKHEVIERPDGCYFYQNNVMLSALQADYVENNPHIFGKVVEKEFEVEYKGVEPEDKEDILCGSKFIVTSKYLHKHSTIEQKLNKGISKNELEKILVKFSEFACTYDKELINIFLNSFFGEN